MSFTIADPRVTADALAEVSSEIAAVEQELSKQVRSEVKLVGEIGAHVLEAGGKRLRPAFVTLSAKTVQKPFDPRRAHKLAACMEMIHMATLIHDDVIDNAATRRGRATASAVFGNTASILSGDVLLSKAMAILAQDGDIEIIRTVSSAVVELAEGEVRELESRGCFELDEEEHFEILRMKTASFIQCCCEVGARLAGGSDDERDALGAYGHHVGLAFQIVDDMLDYAGDNSVTGKPKATDFKEGCATLPLIYLLPKLSPQEHHEIKSIFGQSPADGEVSRICDLIKDRGALDETAQTAQIHTDKAKGALQLLPESSNRLLLEAAADFVVSRSS